MSCWGLNKLIGMEVENLTGWAWAGRKGWRFGDYDWVGKKQGLVQEKGTEKEEEKVQSME